MHTKIQYFFILNLVPFFFFGQGTNEKGFEVKSKIGFLAIQHQSMSHLPKETAKAFEFTYFNQTRGNKLWHKAYRYPTIGATLFIGSVGRSGHPSGSGGIGTERLPGMDGFQTRAV